MSIDAKVSALTASLKTEFWRGWDSTAKPAAWEDFTTVLPSTTRIENFVNATPVPGFSRWSGHRTYGQIDTFVYSIRNETWHSEIQATIEDVDDDQTSILAGKAKDLALRGKYFPGRMVVKLLGKGAGATIAMQDGYQPITAFDGLAFFTNRAVGSAGFGVGNNSLTYTSASGDGKTYHLVALYTGNSILKPVCWQNRSGPDFRTNSGDNQSFESRQVRWWCDLRGAPFFGYWWNSVLVQITNTPSVAEMHAIYSSVENAFRTFQLPKTVSTEDGEYTHEQTVFGSDNLYFVASTALAEQLRQSLNQDWMPQNIGGNTVATTNNWKGYAKYIVSRFMDDV